MARPSQEDRIVNDAVCLSPSEGMRGAHGAALQERHSREVVLAFTIVAEGLPVTHRKYQG